VKRGIAYSIKLRYHFTISLRHLEQLALHTWLNVYGKAMDESKREAHGKVVRLVLPSKVA
jgi:hypothetical protein